MDGTVLIADDDRTIRTVLTQALTRAGCRVHATASLVTLMRWVQEGRGDLVISDVIMPDGNGLDHLPLIASARPGLPVIVISAQNTILTAIRATEAAAFDYLPKPFDLPDLLRRAARALDPARRRPPAAAGAADAAAADAVQVDPDLPLVGGTAAMQALYRLVARVMNTALPVLVTGETGTGKSLIARAIHDFSDRCGMPCVTLTASDLAGGDGTSTLTPETMVARTGGGSLLLDEVSDLSPEAQARAVRMLDQLGTDAPRILATSRLDLARAAEQGRFREDLFYRLGGVVIAVPALRDRVDDLAPLAEHFLARAERDGLASRRLSPGALETIRSYGWPGNVRQLDNAMRRLAATSPDRDIARSEIEAILGGQPAPEPAEGGSDGERLRAAVARHLRRYFDLHGGMLPPAGLYNRILREFEVPMIEIALEATAGNQARCADLLGINRNTLRKKITELDIRVTRRRKLM